MSEYPEDVMKAAYDVGGKIRYHLSTTKEADLIHHDASVDAIIADAIMAERQRCHDLVYWMSLGEGTDFGLQDEIMSGEIPNTPPPGYPGN